MRKIIDNGIFITKTCGKVFSYTPLLEIDDLLEKKDKYSFEDLSAIYQNIKEFNVFSDASPEEKKILCPLIDYKINNRNILELTFIKMKHICSEQEAILYSCDDCIPVLTRFLEDKGKTQEEIEEYYNSIISICEKFSLESEDIFYNLSNLAYDDFLGLRIIDFGMTSELLSLSKFYLKNEKSNNL